MLKCASVHTYEIDDPDVALEEIRKQLEEKIELLDNTVGIIMCHPEFIAAGVNRYISDSLPFDLVGATTSTQAVNGEAGELILTVFIITSDDVRFRAGVTETLDGNLQGTIDSAYAKASEGENALPGLALIFPPLTRIYAGDAFVEAWENAIPGTPLFGTIAIDDTMPFADSETIYNNETFKNALTFILCYGNINPRFLIGTLHLDKSVPYKGEITKSTGPFINEINGISAYKYFEEIGFAKDGALMESFGFVLYVIDQKKRKDYDGVPVVRGLTSFMDDGSALFSGVMDEGSTFSMQTSDYEDVISTTREMTEKVNGLTGVNGVLMLSCIVRRMVAMTHSPLSELEVIRDVMNPESPFMVAYAGGEICPTSIVNGKPTNRFHNYSLVILVL